ncbi:LOW QUALITY PROTEIN: X-linked retinitis pigmentosa GTPase regulator-interacting protein 1 [Rhea pennata]|uniref:LOW QUALITY PROTEIN: X-linked retinitis pigmentosa GTPase regulator-interacting protein 1 n=1 Tax=Rhea pennata TaxID=8795 RepID=UPI002E26A5A8
MLRPLLDETAGELPVRDTDPVTEGAVQPQSHREHLRQQREENWQECTGRWKQPTAGPRDPATRRSGPNGQPELVKALEALRVRAGKLERRNWGLRQSLLTYRQQLLLQRCHCRLHRRPLHRGGRGSRKHHLGMPERALGVRTAHAAPTGRHVAEEGGLCTERLTWGASFPERQLTCLQHGSEAEQQCRLRRAAIQSNVELIRLQRLLRERGVELAGARARLGDLQQAYESQLRQVATDGRGEDVLTTLCQSHPTTRPLPLQHQEIARATGDALLARVEELAGRLAEETRRAAALERRLPRLSGLRRALEEFQERIGDLEQERDLLKEDYDKLLRSSLHRKELPSLPPETLAEAQLPAVLEQETAAQHKELEQRPDGTLLGGTEQEEQWQEEPGTPEHPHVPGLEELLALRQKVHETEAAHAETALELEKTRDMLILQHRLNRNYQAELESVALQAEQERQSHEEEHQQQARLLDLRTARLQQLEGKVATEARLHDFVYGARQLPAPPSDDARAAPSGGEVLLELHVARAALSVEALGRLGDAEPLTFCTYGVYDFETHCTPLALGPQPCYSFTSQYAARGEPLFLRYLRRSAARLELHWAAATEHGTLASCWLRFSKALGHGQRVHATATLRGPSGEHYGVLEYWTRLQLPAEHPNASGSSSEEEASAALTHPTSSPPQMPEPEGWPNELWVRVTGCAGLRARRPGAQPSPYAVYRFFAFPDHTTPVEPGSRAPRFSDLQAFPLWVTAELHRYLRLGCLSVYVFDADDNEPGAYMGKAEVPLLPLARGCSIAGEAYVAAGIPVTCLGSHEAPRIARRRSGSPDPWMHPQSSGRIRDCCMASGILVTHLGLLGGAQDPHNAPGIFTMHPGLLHGIWDGGTSGMLETHLGLPRGVQDGCDASRIPGGCCALGPTGDFTLTDPHGTPNGTISLSLEWQRCYVPPAHQDSSTRRCRAATAYRAPGSLPRHHASARVPEAAGNDLLWLVQAEMPLEALPFLKLSAAAASSEQEALSTDSDEVVVGSSAWTLVPASKRIRVEVVSLCLHTGTSGSGSHLRQLRVAYRFPGVPPAETETPLALREPRGGEEVFFHSSQGRSKPQHPPGAQPGANPAGPPFPPCSDPSRRRGGKGTAGAALCHAAGQEARTQLVSNRRTIPSLRGASPDSWLKFLMLRGAACCHHSLRFAVVSEPPGGAASGKRQELGAAWLDLAEMLRTGCDALERDLDGERVPRLLAASPCLAPSPDQNSLSRHIFLPSLRNQSAAWQSPAWPLAGSGSAWKRRTPFAPCTAGGGKPSASMAPSRSELMKTCVLGSGLGGTVQPAAGRRAEPGWASSHSSLVRTNGQKKKPSRNGEG